MAAASFLSFDHVVLLLCIGSLVSLASADNFQQDFEVTFGPQHAQISENGNQVTFILDPVSGSGLRSKNEYLYGRFDTQIKAVPGNSAGTNTAFYFSTGEESAAEIDLQFLGNLTGEPYTLQTNVIMPGQGGREQQFRLWFDPTADYHDYSILWNPQRIVFYVDGTPIRESRNMESEGVPFPNNPMRVYLSLWNAEWATRGGAVPINWSQAPFQASFRNFNSNACVNGAPASCPSESSWLHEQLDTLQQQRLAWAQQNFMIYNYCTQPNNQNRPECTASGGTT